MNPSQIAEHQGQVLGPGTGLRRCEDVVDQEMVSGSDRVEEKMQAVEDSYVAAARIKVVEAEHMVDSADMGSSMEVVHRLVVLELEVEHTRRHLESQDHSAEDMPEPSCMSRWLAVQHKAVGIGCIEAYLLPGVGL